MAEQSFTRHTHISLVCGSFEKSCHDMRSHSRCCDRCAEANLATVSVHAADIYTSRASQQQRAGKPVAAVVVANNTAGPELFQMAGRPSRLAVPAVLVSLESGESLVQQLIVGASLHAALTATATAACGKPARYCSCSTVCDYIVYVVLLQC
jgi:hypothetical protein